MWLKEDICTLRIQTESVFVVVCLEAKHPNHWESDVFIFPPNIWILIPDVVWGSRWQCENNVALQERGLLRACGVPGAGGMQILGPHPGASEAGCEQGVSPLSEKCWYFLSFDVYFLLIGLSSLFHLTTSLQKELSLKCQIQIGPGEKSSSFST